MNISQNELYAYQIMECLVSEYGYQIIRVIQHKNDLWLVNPDAKEYPVIAIFSQQESVIEEEYVRIVHASMLKMIDREGRLLVLYTNKTPVLLRKEDIYEVVCGLKYCSDERINTQFPLLQSYIRECKEQEEEMAKIARVVEEKQKTNYLKLFRLIKKKQRPMLTYCFLILMFLGCVFSIFMQGYAHDGSLGAIVSGAYYKPSIILGFEYFRLLTAAFVVPSIGSFLIQACSFYFIAKECEKSMKKASFVQLIVGSIVFSYGFLLACGSNQITMGMLPCLYAMTTAWILHVVLHKKYHMIHYQIRIVEYSIVLFVTTMAIPTHWLLMLAGILCGCYFGVIENGSSKFNELKTHVRVAFLMIVCIMIGCWFQVRVEQDPSLEKRVVSFYENSSFDFYANYLQECFNTNNGG